MLFLNNAHPVIDRCHPAQDKTKRFYLVSFMFYITIKPQKLKPCACIITDGNPSLLCVLNLKGGFRNPWKPPPYAPEWI